VSPRDVPSNRRHTAPLATVVVLVSLVAACGQSPAAKPLSEQPLLPAPSGANAADGPIGPLRALGGPALQDRYGRTVLMHGVDLVYKVAPYEVEVGGAVNDLTDAEVQEMASLGFDVVRLGIIWKGLEPGTAGINDKAICTPGSPRPAGAGQFSATVLDGYLQRLDATVALLGRYGIYSIVDMHQDVYSDVFGGEGAPDWAVCTNGATPKPQLNVPNWSVNLQGPGVVTAYEHFWRNDVVGNLQGEFDSIWARVAHNFRDDPWVIGYDPFNEPYGQGLPPAGSGASFDAELQCFYTGRADPGTNQAHQPISCPPDDPEEGLIARIEQADPNHLVFYEGNYATDSGPLNHIGPMPFGHLVLNFHDYCYLHVPNGPEPPGFDTVCPPQENLVFTEHVEQARRDATTEQPGGIPAFLTEFGATTDVSDLARVTADADAHLIGWTYWQWLLYDDPTGSHTSGLWPPSAPTPAMLSVLSRAYPMAVAGTPLSASFNPTNAVFHFSYRNDPRIAQPTVMFMPLSAHYPDGYCASVTGGRVSSASSSPYLDVVGLSTASVVSVTVTPGPCGPSTAAPSESAVATGHWPDGRRVIGRIPTPPSAGRGARPTIEGTAVVNPGGDLADGEISG